MPRRPHRIPARAVHSSSFARRPSASASSSAHEVFCSFVSSAGLPAASNLTQPSAVEPPNTRASGPGQWTLTERPAIWDAIADSRCSLPTRSVRSSTHQAVAASRSTETVSFSHSGVVG